MFLTAASVHCQAHVDLTFQLLRQHRISILHSPQWKKSGGEKKGRSLQKCPLVSSENTGTVEGYWDLLAELPLKFIFQMKRRLEAVV